MMQYVTTEGTQGICPGGWHIPTDEEWKQLEGVVDSIFSYPDPVWDGIDCRGYNAGKNLKTSLGWFSGGNGTNLYGFSALPAGYFHAGGIFLHLNSGAYFWTSSETAPNNAWNRRLTYLNDQICRASTSKPYGFNVRCIKD